MPNVCRQHGQECLDVLALLIPEQQAPDGRRVTQVMDAWRIGFVQPTHARSGGNPDEGVKRSRIRQSSALGIYEQRRFRNRRMPFSCAIDEEALEVITSGR